jgi:C1A family cysteine protease
MSRLAFASVVAAAEAGTLHVTWKDCGAKHGKVTDLKPLTVETGTTTTVTGTGAVDEDVTSGHFKATVSALGTKITECSGDGTKDIVCNLPMGVGSVTLKALPFPIKKGTVSIPVEVKTSSKIPTRLANVDVHVTATDQHGEDAICLDVHTAAKVEEEPQQYAKGFVRQPRNGFTPVGTITPEMRAAAPERLDWTETSGAVSPVKDQSGCGSCWAFSATEGIESAVFQSIGSASPALSTQQIVSCDTVDLGCQGGDLKSAFDYVEKAGGIDTEEDYPYTSQDGKSGSCKSSTPVVKVSEHKFAVPPCTSGSCSDQDEDGLKASLAANGPLSICVNAAWNNYKGGVLNTTCTAGFWDVDHCVQLVGYDTTAPTPYWKVRNSWGTRWGEGGFIRLPMGVNSCGVANEALYVKASLAESVV